ncbi:hypothetical protein VNO80_18029 [Phaseolus coccineus]|uniref:Helicase C-terminal domain-containing protein n=1 Tax=Phaseolus coccineus TaxID=3886 RepID=A0AAN9MD24_PHACN
MMLARNKRVEEAKRVWDDLKDKQVLFDQHTFGDIIRAFLDNGLPSETMEIYEEMRQSHEPPLSLPFPKVIERFAKKVLQTSHFSVSYLTGNNISVDAVAPKRQKEILDYFHSGKVNLLFTTDVLEEGRSRQANSQFVVMLERQVF